MMRAKAAMGFRSVKRVEVKAETTTPGEVRTTTDANGVRVSASRARRTLPKLEFVVEENGAILHGPQRGLFPYYAAAAAASGADGFDATGADGVEDTGRTSAAAAAMDARRSNQETSSGGDVVEIEDEAAQALLLQQQQQQHLPMKDCVLNDSRATTLAVKFDPSRGKFVCGSSIERFSGHTGVCRVLGSKKYPIIPHSLQIGDLLRIGSVGLVVCELNRGPGEADVEALTEDEYQYIKENYLSLPLQQTFRPTDSMGRSNQHDGEEDDDDEEEDDHEGGTNQQTDRMRRPQKMRSGETSDEGESEEDGVKRSSDDNDGEEGDDDEYDDGDNNGSGGATRKKTQRNKSKDALAGSKEKRFCYICYDTDEEPEENPLVAPCNCKGDTKYVHLECLQRWNNNLDADGSNPNHKMCAVTNTDGLDVCSICKATYMTSVKLDDGRVVSLMAKKLPPPYVTFAVVTQHEARSRSTTLTNTRFQLSFANIPRGQQFLTIGRSTTNNMTLRYRTVSQLHAKVKFEDNNFYIYDASSSNGTMLFLSKPLELDWNKTVHVKIGRTILTLKSKKRWKWSGGGEFDEEIISSPRTAALESNQANADEDQLTERLSSHRLDGAQSALVSDPSAELLSSPYAAALRQPLNRTFSMPHHPAHQFSRADVVSTELEAELDGLRLSDLVTEGTFMASNTSSASGYSSTPRRSFGASSRAYPELPAAAIAGSSIPRVTSRFGERSERRLADFTDRLSQMTLESPSATNRLSAPGRFERS